MTGSTQARCPGCDTILGQFVAGHWIIRHRGREWIGASVISIKCEKCGTVWQPPKAGDSAAA